MLAAIWMPFRSQPDSLDFTIADTNNNFHFEVDEPIAFAAVDSPAYQNRAVVWYFGNGDQAKNKLNVSHAYKKAGKYMITLAIDQRYKTSKYIEVISIPKKAALDSIPRIHGVDVGYVNEELVFSSYGPGIDTWIWEFGETGTVDAYEGQVVYVYKKPGTYQIKLKTNTAKYPVKHAIEILPLFEPIEEQEQKDSLALAQDDIKARLQTIADASIKNTRAYYSSLRHIQNQYTCNQAADVVVVVNGARYNDLFSYCQGLHHLEGKGAKTVIIDDVAIDAHKCLKRIEVTQSVIN